MLFVDNIKELKERISSSNSFVLCDENTARDCFPLLELNIPLILIPSGEAHKTLESCQIIWDALISKGADRNSQLICLGGGMICDLGAYAASCFQRGIAFTLVPTSLLAMVDASIGGKCGVDYQNLKNYIGLFAQAEEIIICPVFLKTLPAVELRNGKIEMLKHGLIADKNHFALLSKSILSSDRSIDISLIEQSITIKLQHTERDFNELGIRKRLNFGHSIAHAIESLALQNEKAIAHGLAVGLGMIAESYLSHKYWSLSEAELNEIISVLLPLGNEISPNLLNSKMLSDYVLKDKKNKNGQAYFTLLNHIGSAQENIQLSSLQIMESIQYLSSIHA